jgi:predicted glycogen debranching enzyme
MEARAMGKGDGAGSRPRGRGTRREEPGIHPRRWFRAVLGRSDERHPLEYDEVSGLEWLETNGLGGWAASTVSGSNTRRYHGLLVAAASPPVGRVVLLSKLDESLVLNGRRIDLGSNQYPGAVHPRGYQHLRHFSRGLFPRFRYEAEGVVVTKTVAGIHGENTTVVDYRVEGRTAGLSFELRPMVAGRDFHSLGQAREVPPWSFDPEGAWFRSGPWAGGLAFWLSVPGASFRAAPEWHYRVEYLREMERGLDFREDLWTPGVFRWDLSGGEGAGRRKGEDARIRLVISTAQPMRPAVDLLDREVRRRRALLSKLPFKDRITASLARAADQFIVVRRVGEDGEGGRSVIAGYPWFEDWGRDTMIALPGLCLATGRFNDAREILRTWAGTLAEGMLPNRFPDPGGEPEYNSVDATLWFFVATWSYLAYTSDETFVRTHLLPALREAQDAYRRGTRFGIREDEDGLLLAGEPGQQLTWMDARVGDRVVTPRAGKPVEVNALWYNALSILGSLEDRLWGGSGGGSSGSTPAGRARRMRHRFARTFWYAEGGYLYDVVGVDGIRDQTLRPNQLLALSLPFPLVSARRARSVLAATRRLVTPFGLRTLPPDHGAYRPRYEGDPESRDSAYHQGTVWTWLLGPYLTALARWEGEKGRRRALALLEDALLNLREAAVGSISEVFDGAPDHRPGGAVAQAWSVAELLRSYLEDLRPGSSGPDVGLAQEKGL